MKRLLALVLCLTAFAFIATTAALSRSLQTSIDLSDTSTEMIATFAGGAFAIPDLLHDLLVLVAGVCRNALRNAVASLINLVNARAGTSVAGSTITTAAVINISIPLDCDCEGMVAACAADLALHDDGQAHSKRQNIPFFDDHNIHGQGQVWVIVGIIFTIFVAFSIVFHFFQRIRECRNVRRRYVRHENGLATRIADWLADKSCRLADHWGTFTAEVSRLLWNLIRSKDMKIPKPIGVDIELGNVRNQNLNLPTTWAPGPPITSGIPVETTHIGQRQRQRRGSAGSRSSTTFSVTSADGSTTYDISSVERAYLQVENQVKEQKRRDAVEAALAKARLGTVMDRAYIGRRSESVEPDVYPSPRPDSNRANHQ